MTMDSTDLHGWRAPLLLIKVVNAQFDQLIHAGWPTDF